MDILVIAPEEERAQAVRKALEAGEHRVSIAKTRAEGLAFSKEAPPDVVVAATEESAEGLQELRTALETRSAGKAIPVLPLRPSDTPQAIAAAVSRLKSQPAAEPVDDGTRTILLVDDRDANRMRLVSQFSNQGWKVLEATDGKSTALKLIDGRIDCLVVNAMLSGKTSHAIVRSASEIRKVHPHPYAILVMADAEDSDTANRMMSQGADDVVGRTTGASVLQRRLERALAVRDLLRENRALKERLAALDGAAS
ncbi:response regulator [bacterium]|nr:response regulator [bacterium]